MASALNFIRGKSLLTFTTVYYISLANSQEPVH